MKFIKYFKRKKEIDHEELFLEHVLIRYQKNTKLSQTSIKLFKNDNSKKLNIRFEKAKSAVLES